MTKGGRLATGMLRPDTQSNQGGTSLDRALKTGRNLGTARPVTTATGRAVRLGTVSDENDQSIDDDHCLSRHRC